MKKKILIISIIILFPLYVLGDESGLESWEALCKCNNKTFEITFHSQSGDASENDMLVELIPSNSKPTNIPIIPALYYARAIVSDVNNICDKIGGFYLENELILLWISYDNRPHWDQLSLVLIDAKQNKILDIKEGIGSIKDADGNQKLTIRKKEAGFEVRLEREWLKNTGSDSAENSIEDWMYIQIIENKIIYKWHEK